MFVVWNEVVVEVVGDGGGGMRGEGGGEVRESARVGMMGDPVLRVLEEEAKVRREEEEEEGRAEVDEEEDMIRRARRESEGEEG